MKYQRRWLESDVEVNGIFHGIISANIFLTFRLLYSDNITIKTIQIDKHHCIIKYFEIFLMTFIPTGDS